MSDDRLACPRCDALLAVPHDVRQQWRLLRHDMCGTTLQFDGAKFITATENDVLIWAWGKFGLPPGATDEALESARRKRAAAHHPDRVANMATEIRSLADLRTKDLNQLRDALKSRNRLKIEPFILHASERVEPTRGPPRDVDHDANARTAAQARASTERDARARAEREAAAHAEREAAARAQTEAQRASERDAASRAERAAADARARAHEDARAAADARARAEQDARAAAEARARAEGGVGTRPAVGENAVPRIAPPAGSIGCAIAACLLLVIVFSALTVYVVVGPENSGTIEIHTAPPGSAVVSLDGVARGPAPVRLEHVPAGERVVTVTFAHGPPQVRHVRVTQGSSAVLEVAAPKTTSPIGVPPHAAPESTPGFALAPRQVGVPGDDPLGFGEDEFGSVPADGVPAEDVGPPDRDPSRPSAPTSIAARVRFGDLVINTMPWARIFVDGHDTGRNTPLQSYRVRAGHHTLGLRTPDNQMHEMEVDVLAGETVRIVRRL